MKKKMSRRISLFIAVLCFLPLVRFSFIPADATEPSGIQARLDELKVKYPNDSYWNHLVTSDIHTNGDNLLKIWKNGDRAVAEQFADSVTNVPCYTHKGVCPAGFYDCNVFDGGMQCWGFARKIFFDIFGVRCSSLEIHTDVAGVRVGDYVRFGSDDRDKPGHSFVVIGRDGNIVTVVECNYGTNDKIHWGRRFDITKSVDGISFSYYYRAPNYDQVNSSPAGIVPGVTYTMAPQCAPNSRLDVEWGSTNSEANIQIYSANKSAAQQFMFEPMGNGYFRIIAKVSGKAVDVCHADTACGTNIWQYDVNGTDAQLWKAVVTEDGFVCFIPKVNPSLRLDVYEARSADMTNVQTYWNNQSGAQKWILSICY